MTDLYRRILLWHKLVAMQTGGLALCSAKHRLNRVEATGWADALQNVADDIRAFLHDGTFVLDDKGRRVLGYVGDAKPRPETGGGPDGVGSEEGRLRPKGRVDSEAVSPKKAGGLRVARRK